ncbi:MAG: hypothetical protein E7164_01875 [Firmicutes bacterium]|nr:hypothetical protein [Bacillota bacterium]
MSRKNKTIVWLLLFVFLIVIFTSLGTYAFFEAREYFYGNFDVEVTTKGVDTLAFTGNHDIELVANANNFAPDIGYNLTGRAKMEVKLDTTKASASYCYELKMNLPEEKVFTYSVGSNRPDLLLNVRFSSDGKQYESIISNMDITEKTGVIDIPVGKDGNVYLHKIETTKNITNIHNWQADITLVWFDDVDQVINDNKTYSAFLEAKRVDCN